MVQIVLFENGPALEAKAKTYALEPVVVRDGTMSRVTLKDEKGEKTELAKHGRLNARVFKGYQE